MRMMSEPPDWALEMADKIRADCVGVHDGEEGGGEVVVSAYPTPPLPEGVALGIFCGVDSWKPTLCLTNVEEDWLAPIGDIPLDITVTLSEIDGDGCYHLEDLMVPRTSRERPVVEIDGKKYRTGASVFVGFPPVSHGPD